jgi:hypothetical protein
MRPVLNRFQNWATGPIFNALKNKGKIYEEHTDCKKG